MKFSKTVLNMDPSLEIPKISGFIQEMCLKKFKRKGAVIGLSGGIDSAVVAELCVHALGKDRVIGLLLPEKESNPVSLEYGRRHAAKMGIETITVDITENLESFQAYHRRNHVIRKVFPEFTDGYRFHVTLPQNLLEKDRLNYYSLTIEDQHGNRQKKRLPGIDWRKISACQNMKQRIRMIQLYYHAEQNNYIVAGTTNKTELIQGFYLKFGDGGVDFEPIAHLYKTQVYTLARHLGVIDKIINRPPSPDTYSLPVTDKEFYFCLDYELLDLLLYAYENNVPIDQAAQTLDLKTDQIKWIFKDIRAKEQATWHLRETPPSLTG
jgi:NAD+ synthase